MNPETQAASFGPSTQPSAKRPGRGMGWSRGRLIFIVVVVALVGLRLALPMILRAAINHRLNRVPSFIGHVDGVGLSFIRGAYTMSGVEIQKRSGQTTVPFFSARKIDFSVAWRELIHGKLVSDIEVDQGRINFVKGPSQESSQLEADRRWQEVVNDLFPIEITHFEINHGSIHFLDTAREPKVDISITDLHALAEGLRNRPAEKRDEFPAKITAEGETIGGGHLSLFVQAEPLADRPHFGLKFELRGVSLPALNSFLRAYSHVDVSRGRFELYLEVAARGGRYEGYVKPFFEDLKFKGTDDQNKNLGQRIWESLVATVAAMVKNHSENQLATRIPFAGEFGQTQVGVWATITNLLHNGFVRALNQGLEGSVHPDAVKPAGEPPEAKKNNGPGDKSVSGPAPAPAPNGPPGKP